MLNNMCTACGTLGLILILVFGRNVASYITTSVDQVGDSVHEHVPVELEIERAKGIIAEISPQIRQQMYWIAREEVEVEQLAGRIDRLRDEQKTDKTSLTNLQRELATGSAESSLEGTICTSVEAAKATFARCETFDATLQNLTRTLDARRRGLDAAQKQRDSLIQAKQQLTAKVASFEVRQKMLEFARSSMGSSFHDSQLAQTRELLREIETRIEVEERLASAKIQLAEKDIVLHPAAVHDSRRVADRITEYFEPSNLPAKPIWDQY